MDFNHNAGWLQIINIYIYIRKRKGCFATSPLNKDGFHDSKHDAVDNFLLMRRYDHRLLFRVPGMDPNNGHFGYTPENQHMTSCKTKHVKMYVLLKVVIFYCRVVFSGEAPLFWMNPHMDLVFHT